MVDCSAFSVWKGVAPDFENDETCMEHCKNLMHLESLMFFTMLSYFFFKDHWSLDHKSFGSLLAYHIPTPPFPSMNNVQYFIISLYFSQNPFFIALVIWLANIYILESSQSLMYISKIGNTFCKINQIPC